MFQLLLKMTLIFGSSYATTSTMYQRSKNISVTNFEAYKTKTMITGSNNITIIWWMLTHLYYSKSKYREGVKLRILAEFWKKKALNNFFKPFFQVIWCAPTNVSNTWARVTLTAMTMCPWHVHWPVSSSWRTRLPENPPSPSWRTWVLSTVWRWGKASYLTMMTYEEVSHITDAEVGNIAASRTTSGKCTVIVMYNYSVLRMCGEGEGDCDTDSDCDIGLVCGDNNCSSQVSKHGSWIMGHR